jgi:hypothetical protein
MVDSVAARKQAEGAARHLEGILAQDPKVKYNKNNKNKLNIFLFRKLIQKKLLHHLVIHHDILNQNNMKLKLKNINTVC